MLAVPVERGAARLGSVGTLTQRFNFSGILDTGNAVTVLVHGAWPTVDLKDWLFFHHPSGYPRCS